MLGKTEAAAQREIAAVQATLTGDGTRTPSAAAVLASRQRIKDIKQTHSSFLQQAALITGGVYYTPAETQHATLMQVLTTLFLPSPQLADALKQPVQVRWGC